MVNKDPQKAAAEATEKDFNAQGYTLDDARHYTERRFTRDARMRRLDAFERRFARDLLARIGSDAHVVDIPCGSGRFAEIFAAGGRVTLIDLLPEMLQAARETVGTRDGVAFVEGDIRSIPLPDGAADLCFCMRLFHHFRGDPIRTEALEELARVSRRFVALSFYNQSSTRYYWRSLLRKKIRGGYITLAHLSELARAAGLRFVERRPRVNLREQQCLVLFEKS